MYPAFILTILLVLVPPRLASRAEEFIHPMRHEVLLVTGKTFDPLLNRQRNSHAVTVLLQFDAKDAKHKKFIDEVYDKAARELKGMVRFAAVDCNEWRMFCKETHNPDLKYPTVIVFSPNRLLPPQVLPPTADIKTLTTTALQFITGNYVTNTTAKNIDSFVTQNVAMPKVLLFSAKNTVPVLFKALSNAFADRVMFGFVSPEEKSLEERYKIKKRPTVITMRADTKNPEVYTGNPTFTDLHAWVNVHAETFVKGGGFSADESLVETPPKPWLVQKVPEITGPSHQDVCFRGSSSLCVIYLKAGTLTDDERKMLENFALEYPDTAERGARFRWGWMDIEQEKGFAELFETAAGKLPSLVVINPHKRLRYVRLPHDKEANATTIRELLEKIISGDGRFTLIKGQKLPSFASRQEGTANKKNSKEEL